MLGYTVACNDGTELGSDIGDNVGAVDGNEVGSLLGFKLDKTGPFDGVDDGTVV